MNYGVLPHKKAGKLFRIVTERKKQQRTGGMQNSSPARKKKKAKIVKEESINPDLQVSSGEKMGSCVL